MLIASPDSAARIRLPKGTSRSEDDIYTAEIVPNVYPPILHTQLVREWSQTYQNRHEPAFDVAGVALHEGSFSRCRGRKVWRRERISRSKRHGVVDQLLKPCDAFMLSESSLLSAHSSLPWIPVCLAVDGCKTRMRPFPKGALVICSLLSVSGVSRVPESQLDRWIVVRIRRIAHHLLSINSRLGTFSTRDYSLRRQ